MLNIILTTEITDRTISAIDGYFDSAWEPEWIDNDFARMVIQDVDQSKVIAPRIIDSPYLGYVDPTWISGGVKCLLCMMFDDDAKWIFDISVCGNNCSKWIQYIGEQKDITVQLGYLMKFFNGNNTPFRVDNDGIIVHNMKEFISVYARYLI